MPTILSLFFYKKVAKNLERIGKVAIFAAQMWYAIGYKKTRPRNLTEVRGYGESTVQRYGFFCNLANKMIEKQKNYMIFNDFEKALSPSTGLPVPMVLERTTTILEAFGKFLDEQGLIK